jgi:hypothetical protein
MSKFHVTVDSPYEGVNQPHFEGDITTPLTGQMADDLGRYPSAQQIATHFASEYCDSGSVIVVGNGERGRELRSNLPL